MKHGNSLLALGLLLSEELMSIGKLIVDGLLLEALFGKLTKLLLLGHLILLNLLSIGLLFLEHVLGLLSLHASILALLVVLGKVLHSLLLLLDNLLIDAIELSILLDNLVDELLVHLNIFVSALLDLLEELDILRLNFLLLGLVVLDEFLHLSDLPLELCHLRLVLLVDLIHLEFGLISDLLGLLKGVLGHDMVLVQILGHVLKLVKVSQLPLLVVHNDLFFFLDGFHNLLHLGVQVKMHSLDVISFGLVRKKFQKFGLLCLKVHWWGTL